MKTAKDLKSIVKLAQSFALESANSIAASIKAATKNKFDNIIVMSHVPFFRESHYHNGAPGDVAAVPWFTNKYCGDMMLAAAQAYPNVRFTVLTGHTHSRWSGKLAPNLWVHVAHAEYGLPSVADVIEIGE
jgi:hypothetical protein